jgi:hypothetical protein
MSDFEQVQIQPDQFKVLEQRLNALRGQMQIVTERLGPVDAGKSIQQTLESGLQDLRVEITKWLSIQNDTMSAGFAMVAEALISTNLPPPQPRLKGRFTLILKNDQPDFGYDFDVSGITDAEGEEITDPAVLAKVVKEVTSTNDGVVSATSPDEGGAGTIHIGTSGEATLSGKAWFNQADKDAGKDPAFLASEPFTITTGDPAAITEGGFKFDIESGGTPSA